MKIKIWGARGSIPAPLKPGDVQEKIVQAILRMPPINTEDQETVRAYVDSLPALLRGTAGGNTTCIEVRAGGELIVLDAGSGLRELGLELMKGPFGQGKGKMHLMFTHPHWDHIQGFPFFIPAYVPGNQIIIHGVHDFEEVLKHQQVAPVFPVPLERMKAERKFIRVEPGVPFNIGTVHINTIENAHPGRAFSYRFDDGHSVFVFATDSEYKQLEDERVQPHIGFFQNADLLYFDAQYTLRESWQKVDWGHSSAMIGVDLARAAGVRKLLLGHHDPTYTDDELLEIRATALAYQKQVATQHTCEIWVAYEGLTLDLAPEGAVDVKAMPEEGAQIVTPFNDVAIEQLVVPEETSTVIVDLSQFETLTTGNLKALVALSEQNEAITPVLVVSSDRVAEVINLAGYADFFAVYPSREQAIEAIRAREALGLPGQVVKTRYRIESKIGESRLGTALNATDLQLNQPVALKVLRLSFSHSRIEKMREISQQLSSLSHPNLLHVYEMDEESSQPYLVEELAEGPTLGEHLSNPESSTSPEEALQIALQIARTLEYAHSRGVIHGDLRPQNIFLTPNGPKISDFGFGGLGYAHGLLERPLRFLDACFLTPEQISGQALDARTDLYTLGVILYRLFVGRLPFDGEDHQVLQAHLNESPPAPRELQPAITRSLEHLILKLLAKNPNERYASARQVRRILERLRVGETVDGDRTARLLVGRELDLKQILACWRRASTGQGQLVFIVGEAGIGKTALAQKAAVDCNPLVLLYGHCEETGIASAYQLFAGLLGDYFETVPPELQDDEARGWIANFAHLIPMTRTLLPDLPVPVPLEPKQEQIRLMSSLARFIRRATETRAWLMVLEDLHLVDEGSLEILKYLARQLPEEKLMVIGTYRDEELSHGHPLLEALRAMHSIPGYMKIELGRLGTKNTHLILKAIWGEWLPTELSRKIFERTGGNPFYVEEVARNLVDSGQVIYTDGVWQFPPITSVRLPESIHETVLSRIRLLNPSTQDLLRQAAVLGEAFEFTTLQGISRLSEWEVLEYLDEGLERRLIRETPRGSSFQFEHMEVQEVLYADLGSLRRRMLHLRAGEVLEQRAIPNPESIAEELGYHFAEAGEGKRALVYMIHAARVAKRAYANESAIHWYQRTLAVLDQMDEEVVKGFEPWRFPVHYALGEIQTLVGRYDKALEHFEVCRALLEALPQSRDRAQQLADLFLQIAEVYEKKSDYETAFEWLEKSSEQIGEESSIALARVDLMEATVHLRQGSMEKAISACQRGLEIARQVKTNEGEKVMGQGYYLLGNIYAQTGQLEKVIEVCEESLTILEQTGNLVKQAKGLINLGMSFLYLGNWPAARRTFQKGLEISQKAGDIASEGRFRVNLGFLYMKSKDLKKAEPMLQDTFRISKELGEDFMEAVALSNLGQLSMYQENWALAERYIRESEEICKRIGTQQFAAELERQWGELYLNTGRLGEALETTQLSIEIAQADGLLMEEGISQRVLGRIYLSLGELDQAQAALRKSLALLEEIGSEFEAARTVHQLAQVEAERGETARARELLDETVRTFTNFGAMADMEEARELKKRLEMI